MKSLKKGQIFTEIIVCLLIAALLLTACDVDMQVYKCRVVKEPTRTEYPVGYNGDIDMNGVEIIGIHRNGTDYDLGKIDFQPYSRYSLNTPKTVYWDDSEVDYSMPGEYYIYIYYLNKNKADCISKLKVDTEKCLLFLYNEGSQGGEKNGKERDTASKVQQGRKAEDCQRTFGGA